MLAAFGGLPRFARRSLASLGAAKPRFARHGLALQVVELCKVLIRGEAPGGRPVAGAGARHRTTPPRARRKAQNKGLIGARHPEGLC